MPQAIQVHKLTALAVRASHSLIIWVQNLSAHATRLQIWHVTLVLLSELLPEEEDFILVEDLVADFAVCQVWKRLQRVLVLPLKLLEPENSDPLQNVLSLLLQSLISVYQLKF